MANSIFLIIALNDAFVQCMQQETSALINEATELNGERTLQIKNFTPVVKTLEFSFRPKFPHM